MAAHRASFLVPPSAGARGAWRGSRGADERDAEGTPCLGAVGGQPLARMMGETKTAVNDLIDETET